MNERIYLDYNATTPLPPEVVAAMRPYLEQAFGNPSSLHWAGVPARDAVETARSQVAALLCCDATEIVFTSGGTEANNQAIKGVLFSVKKRANAPHFITSQIEHPAVLESCQFAERLGAEVTRLPVDRHGLVDPEDVRRAIRRTTVLVSVMHANNEVGTIQPIEDIARISREHGVLCHTDAAQTVGKVAVDCESLGVDLLTVAGHKLYGPKGVGALFIREGVALEPLLQGAHQEAGHRAGTENVLAIAGLGAACELASRWLDDTRAVELRDHFWHALQDRFDDRVILNGHLQRRLPNTLSVGFQGYLGSEILAQLPDVAASTGAACHAGRTEMSSVLQAMGVDEAFGLGTIRFSLGRNTTVAQIDRVVQWLTSTVRVPSRKANLRVTPFAP